eukprot:NODE_496_length_786_cov_969.019727_g487_i0.p1 GENE.NODE_496_length_786_cov_969.019727_g487_i0~~NODE_496_length_786_cov_969.019727_g487_i0.p1  ORF type:complete len:165 (-),score=18.86 NODE_496_length_786_cov_969.019727_g487_i0:291-722(-)
MSATHFYHEPLSVRPTIGLGFRLPRDKRNANFKHTDKKCPFAGKWSVRGRIMRGIIVSKKMTNTVVLRRNYLHYRPKYQRFEKRHKNFSAHLSPVFDAALGDEAIAGECRPMTKTVRFTVVQVNAKSKKNSQALLQAKKFKKF